MVPSLKIQFFLPCTSFRSSTIWSAPSIIDSVPYFFNKAISNFPIGIPNSHSLQILGKTQVDVFPILRFLVKSLINKNCHKSRTINDIDKKLGSVIKLEIWQCQNNLKMTSCRQIMTLSSFFPIYSWFRAIRNPDSRHMVYGSYIFINSYLLSYKKWKQNLKISTVSYYGFEYRHHFC